MKKSVFTIAMLIGLLASQSTTAQESEMIALRVPNFAKALVEKWVSEYQQSHQGVDFQFVAGKSQDNVNSITLTTDDDAVQVARFAVLPVTSKGSEAEQLIGSRSLNAKKLRQLFFVKDELDDEQKESKLEKQLHIITGNSQQSASRLYASHFKQEAAGFKGKKIQGDDSFLNMAISRDPLAVTVNALSNIYDLESRQIRQTLALLPLDLDREGRQALSEGSLDALLTVLEQEQYAEIPVGTVGFEYNHANAALTAFVSWVLQNGTQYVHQYGLLSLPQKELTAQQRKLEQKDLAQK